MKYDHFNATKKKNRGCLQAKMLTVTPLLNMFVTKIEYTVEMRYSNFE